MIHISPFIKTIKTIKTTLQTIQIDINRPQSLITFLNIYTQTRLKIYTLHSNSFSIPMGNCFGTKDSQTKINLKHLILRLKTTAPLQKNKLSRKLQKDQATLIQQFHKQKKQRTKPIEDCQIQQIVFLSNTIQLWGVIENCCSKIIDYYAMLQDQNNFAHIQKQIEILLFLKSILNNRDLDEIYKMIIRRYKINEPIIIQNQVANYHKHSNSPDQKMRNEYIMNLCQNRQLELARINQAGHNFRYGI